MSIIDQQTVEDNYTNGNFKQDIPSLQSLMEDSGISFWKNYADTTSGLSHKFIMPVLESMEDKILKNEKKLSSNQYSDLFNINSPLNLNLDSISKGKLSPFKDTISINIPKLPSALLNREMGYLMTFESLEIASQFLDAIDPNGESVAKLARSRDGTGTCLGALYEIKGRHTKTAKTKDSWALHLI